MSVYHCNNNAKAIALQRWDQQDPKDSVVVAVNVKDKTHDNYVIGFPRPGVWKARFKSDSYNYGRNFANHATPDTETWQESRDGQPVSGRISIGTCTVVTFSQDE